MNIPMIRLEVQSMKHSMVAALSEHAARMDADLRAAVEQFCTEENLADIINQEAKRALDAALREEVQNFFKWNNNGRLAVRSAVYEHLQRMYPIEGGDSVSVKETPNA